MAAYNESAEELRLSIESILHQTYKDLELILIVDQPHLTKQQQAILNELQASDPRLKITYNPKNIGLVASLNLALTLVKGTYIARMDADDISYPKRLEYQLAYLEANHCDLVGAYFERMDEHGVIVSKEKPKTDLAPKTIQKMLAYTGVIPHPTWLAKKEVFDVNKGYRDLDTVEDYDFLLRAIEHGFVIGKVPEVLLSYRIRETGISRSNSYCQFQNALLVRKYHRKHQLLNTTPSMFYKKQQCLQGWKVNNHQRFEASVGMIRTPKWTVKLQGGGEMLLGLMKDPRHLDTFISQWYVRKAK